MASDAQQWGRTYAGGWCRMMSKYLFILVIWELLQPLALAATIELTNENFDSTIGKSHVAFINFYAEWCRYSQLLKPTFEEASNQFAGQPEVLFGAVDCDRQQGIAQRFQISKYPTLKIFRFGELVKKEYRGQRSVDALVEHVKTQLVNNIAIFNSQQELDSKISRTRRNVIAYFVSGGGVDYDNYLRGASALKEDCGFWLGVGEWVRQHIPSGVDSSLQYRSSDDEGGTGLLYTGAPGDFANLKQWLADRCIPLIREITFENAEELTEEGIPFLILFRNSGDTESEKLFREAVRSQLSDQKTQINCLVADGKKFSHPLQHLGKGERDLPLIAIDSFRHMVEGRLREFVMDLHSGKLHREFHHGPDPPSTDAPPPAPQANERSQLEGVDQPPSQATDQPPSLPSGAEKQEPSPRIAEKPSPNMERARERPSRQPQPSTPPISVFKHLKPSETRYSLLNKEEL